MDSPRILIVDDSDSFRCLIRSVLVPLQAEIEEARNGLEGLDRVLNTSFDLVITDVNMPKMSGIDFCRFLKRKGKDPALPVIMVSAFDSEEDVNRGFEAGVEAYVPKSELKACLLQTVREVLTSASFHKDKTILIVDDSVSIRRIVSEGLKKTGFRVDSAENGRAALAVMRRNRPDLIVSDIEMPEMGGMELCRIVKSDEQFSSIPFVVMSTSKERAHMKRMIKRGASSYILKPFHLDHLVILVEKLLSDHVSLMLKDRDRLERERELMLGGITSLISALEARDAYTRGHSDAVAKILSKMVALTGAGRAEIETATIGGRLHDIGKIGVPDAILLKPGKLTKQEFNEIKNHPVTGKNIIEPITSLSDVIPIVYSHHERWDGRGYPLGLKGEDIPLLARFAAVADAYHALVSDRPYRKGMLVEKALQIIRDGSGTQFCPESASLFLELHAPANSGQLKTGTFG